MAAVARFLMTPNKDMNYAVRYPWRAMSESNKDIADFPWPVQVVTVSYSIMLVIGIALLVAEKVFQVSVVAGFWIVVR